MGTYVKKYGDHEYNTENPVRNIKIQKNTYLRQMFQYADGDI